MSNLENYRKWHMRFSSLYIVCCMGIILANPLLKSIDIYNDNLEKILYKSTVLEPKNIVIA